MTLELKSEGEKPKIKVAEFSNVEELGKIFEVTSSEIIQICIELGMLVTKNQRMNWDIVELLADHFGYIPEKITDIGENLFEIDDTDEDMRMLPLDPQLSLLAGMLIMGKPAY